MDVVASGITFLSSIISSYRAIKNLRKLPREFQEVERRLPLVQQTLTNVNEQLKREGCVSTSTKTIIENSVARCMADGTELKAIFDGINKQDCEGTSIVRCTKTLYRKSQELRRAPRVRELMAGMADSVKDLADNQIFRTATREQVAGLAATVSDMDPNKAAPMNIAPGSQHIHYGNNTTTSGTIIGSNVGNISFGNESNEDRFKVMRSLAPVSYEEAKNAQQNRIEGTCLWFTEHDKFKEWNESQASSFLFVSADPGCGKSVLARHLVDSVLQTSDRRTVCYFFFDENITEQSLAVNALRCLLHQVFSKHDNLLTDAIVERFKKSDQIINSVTELWNILMTATSNPDAGEIVCVLDALDECTEDGLKKLAREMMPFYTTRPRPGISLKFLVTSRPYDHILRPFLAGTGKRKLAGTGKRKLGQSTPAPIFPVIHLQGDNDEEVGKISKEIDIVIESKVADIRRNRGLSADATKELLDVLKANQHRTYLWVYLTLDWVEDELRLTKGKIRSLSSRLPRTVDTAYEKILSRSPDDRPQTLKALHIIAAASRPLTLEEMNVALAIEQKHRNYEDLDDDLAESGVEEYIRGLCGLLVSIVDSKINFLHQTVKEFLVQEAEKQPSQEGWKHCLGPQESHEVLYRVCSRVLLLDDCCKRRAKRSDYEQLVLFKYSALFWVDHYKRMGTDDTKTALALIGSGVQMHARPAWYRYLSKWRVDHDLATPLVRACYYGLDTCVSLFLKGDPYVSFATRTTDEDLVTEMGEALLSAAENGHANVVRLLVTSDDAQAVEQYIDYKDENYRSSLAAACFGSHVECVQLLLDAGADTEFPNEFGTQALIIASGRGNEENVKLLLEAGASKDAANEEDGKTALICASENGHEGCVELLLKEGVRTDVTEKPVSYLDMTGKTALMYASQNGYEGCVKLLLEAGARTDPTDEDGRDALICASENGHEGCVKLLLEAGASKDAADDLQGTAMLYAYTFGHQGVVDLLHQDVDVAAMTAFFYNAIAAGLREIVGGLLRKHSFPFTGPDGETPLTSACKHRSYHMIRLLIDNGFNISLPGSHGYKPLWFCSSSHQYDSVEAIISKARSQGILDEDGVLKLLSTRDESQFSTAELQAFEEAKYGLSIYAARFDDLDFAKLLYASRSLAYEHTEARPTDLEVARYHRSSNVWQFLLDRQSA